MQFYSQYGEDKVIAGILGEDEISKGGRVLDIGAWDPIDKSNSRMLIEAGWQGVLIECSPGPLRELVKKYAASNIVVVCGAVVATDEKFIDICITDDAVSSADSTVVNTWKSVGGYFGWLWVPTITVQTINDRWGGFDVVSIDTEGTSVDVARAYLASGARPRVMIVEHDNRDGDLMNAAQMDYVMSHRNSTNAILVRK